MQTKHDKSRAETFPGLKQYEAGYPWRDRRSGFDRRRFRDRRLLSEQRSGKDRRSPELPETIKYRRARTQLRSQLKAYQASYPLKRRFIGAIILAMVALSGGFFFLSSIWHMGNCDMPPRPGVDWSNCLLSGRVLVAANLNGANLLNSSLKGADLSQASLNSAVLTYANLAFANLRHVDLSDAMLRSANLCNADLSHARLDYADLSYADLSGAHLDGASLQGAKLDYAIWPDRRECAPKSIGFCR
ncbi:pentapeptide repeat-containing protein [Nitrosococcus wardiae]|uniref:Pentapeptide repeat-containing protein n=1 Tax=Nitrosococcus wardiae TaxID=1814290 RepID=A0A4P7BUA9_9GAMM|nr:pentapeptide repeat-containing protein [Nitrosococcus wardiae]QBQ53498.1 pentapeptide repeat-containing protein [Nitrosococcus wardiae]